MATITREQFNKWNAKAQNGFRFDLTHYVTWGEKQLIKNIKNEDGTVTQYILSYFPEHITHTNKYGCRWREETGRHFPTIQKNRLHPLPSGLYSVHHGEYIKVGEAQKTRNYNLLCKLSGTVDTDNINGEIAA